MKAFLRDIAEQILREHPNDTDRVTVVFNNRRSGLFLRKHFAQLDKESFFLPKITVIDDLVAQLGGLEIVPSEFLLFELYDIHCALGGDNRKYATFQDFISFGDLMMADFSEIDLYMADARQLFINLHDIKAIGEWDISGKGLTPFQEQYLEFYRSLYQYYTQLRERLFAQGKAYSGMAYRNVAEHIDSMIDMHNIGYVYFVGFNVLSECERTIIHAFCNRGLGQLVTDGDPYYYDDPRQEAGLFLRRHSAEFSSIGHYESHFNQGRKHITVVKCPENVLQCKYAGQLLADHKEWAADNTQTAIVLADEKLLIPTLNSLPEEITAANITMGYPYTDSNAHEMVLKLFSLYIHSRSGRYHHADILNVLSDFHIAKLHGANDLRTKISHQLVSRNVIYADSELIGEMLSAEDCDPTLTDFIFVADGKPTAETFWNVCREIVSRLAAAGLNESNHKEREALGCMIEIANYLTELQQSRHYIENLETLQKIYSRIAQRRSVSFFGQPLSGLQILGMLETRNLDFKRVILLSANEGILPAGRSANTLIPYDLKATFNLPTYHEKDAVFAYHFYRLLQRAEEIWLVCSTETDSSGKGEPSRFILQVANELAPRFVENIELSEQIVEVENLAPILTPRKPAEKSDFVMRRLNEMNERGFSPSALNNYRACPMKFYYENILRIRENKDIVEDMDQSDLGTCIHETLQQIFTATDGGLLSVSTLSQHIENLDITLQSKFDSLFAGGRALEGRNHLLYSVAKSQILNLLKLEIAELEKGRRIEIVGLEKELSHNIQVGDKSVKLSGIADRIDRRGGVVCICDYKTGRVDEKELAMDDNKMVAGTVPDKWFQVMFYALMYSRMTGGAEPMLSGIYPLRHLGRYLIAATWNGEAIIENELLDRVENMIRDLMAEIFDPTIPFTPAEDCKVCRFCPAKATCPFSTDK